jgi:hypothetical protein
MAVRNLTSSSERDLLWEWMRAEIDHHPGNPRADYRTGQAALEAHLHDRLARNDREGLSDEDWTRLRQALHGIRGDYIAPFLTARTTWSYGDFAIADLGSVRLINATISFLPLAPSRRIDDFVASLDEGNATPNDDFSDVYHSMRIVFDSKRARGCPVLIAQRPEGPYVLAEGLTRACVLVSRWRSGEATPPSIRVLLGVSLDAPRWRWW